MAGPTAIAVLHALGRYSGVNFAAGLLAQSVLFWGVCAGWIAAAAAAAAAAVA